MLDKLKFWNKEEAPADPFPNTLGDPLATPDPLQTTNPDPLQGANDPFQSALETARQGYQEYEQAGQQQPQQSSQQYASLQNSPFDQQPQQKYEQYEVHQSKDRDTELILAKLDAIKSELDSVHQRVRRLEEQSERKKQQYW